MLKLYLQHYYQRTRETLLREGTLACLWRIVIKCASRTGTLGIVNLYKMDLAQHRPTMHSRITLPVNTAMVADLEALIRLRMYDLQRTGLPLDYTVEHSLRLQTAERFRRGWKCYVARANDEIVHMTWVAREWTESVGHRFMILQDHEACVIDAYTAEAWRNQGIYRQVAMHILRDLRAAGVRRAYVLVQIENHASRRVHHALGFQLMGTVLYFAAHRIPKTWALPLQRLPTAFLEHTIAT